jgi:hypothetical protein
MRRFVAVWLCIALSVPTEAFAQVRAVLPSAKSAPGAVPVLPNIGAALPLSSSFSPSLNPSLSQLPVAPSIYSPSVAVALSVPKAITPVLPVKTPLVRARPSLEAVASRLTASTLTSDWLPRRRRLRLNFRTIAPLIQ